MIDLFVLFFIHPQSKRAIISGITANPDSAWVTQQARNVTIDIENLGFPTPDVLIIDQDSKSTKEFDAVWSAEGTRVKRVGPFAPNLNAFAERFAQTLRHKGLDCFLNLGEKHLWNLLKKLMNGNTNASHFFISDTSKTQTDFDLTRIQFVIWHPQHHFSI